MAVQPFYSFLVVFLVSPSLCCIRGGIGRILRGPDNKNPFDGCVETVILDSGFAYQRNVAAKCIPFPRDLNSCPRFSVERAQSEWCDLLLPGVLECRRRFPGCRAVDGRDLLDYTASTYREIFCRQREQFDRWNYQCGE